MLRRPTIGLFLLLLLAGAACGMRGDEALSQAMPTTTTPAALAGNPAATPVATDVPPTNTKTLVPIVVTSTPESATETIPLTIDDYELQVELATTNAERSQGLMFREDMSENAGMLFVYPDERQLSFWMRNTLIPLSIAFLDAEKRIINIEQMEPLDEGPRYRSAAPAQYALEVNQGWFAEREIEAGAQVEFTLPPDRTIE